MAALFRTKGQTDELIKGVADLDYKLRALAREATVPGSRSSPRKLKAAAAPADSNSGSVVSWSPSASPEVVGSVEGHGEDEEEDEEGENEDRGRSPVKHLLGSVRGRSLSPRLCELVGRAFIQYVR